MSLPVPLTPRQKDYVEFLKTRFWSELSNRCKKRDGQRCIECTSPKLLQAHHLFYRADWFKTHVNDLVTLCDGCHDKVHAGKLVITREKVARSRQRKLKKIIPIPVIYQPPKVKRLDPVKEARKASRRQRKAERRAFRTQQKKEKERLAKLPQRFNDESVLTINGNVTPHSIAQFIPFLTDNQKRTLRNELERIYWKFRPEWPSRLAKLENEVKRWQNIAEHIRIQNTPHTYQLA